MTSFKTPPNGGDGPVVLQVLPALNDGGVEQSAAEMALYLLRIGWRPEIASNGGKKAKALADAGVVLHTLPLDTKTPWGVLANVVRLYRVIRTRNVQLVHARSRAPAWSAWFACRLARVPFLTTFHGTYGLKGGALKRFYNSVMVKGPLVVANSPFIREHILENYQVSPKKVLIACRGVDETLFNPSRFGAGARAAVRRELEVPEGVPLLLMVGRLTSWKGHDLFLRALAGLPHRRWVAALAGGNDPRKDLMAQLKALAAELGIADNLRWLGSRDDIPRLYAASDLAFSCSTRPEAFGRVAVEAMAMGVPVIATGLGGSLDTVVDGKTGWLVPPARNGEIAPQAVTEKIILALRHPKLLATMGKNARAHVLAHFTATKTCEAEVAAYRRILAPKNGL